MGDIDIVVVVGIVVRCVIMYFFGWVYYVDVCCDV